MTRYIWVLALYTISGCANKSSDRLLPEDEMAKVLWDMVQADELATIRLAKDTGKNVKTERIQLYKKVFQLHKISEEQFSKSFHYYSGHPDQLKVIFDTLEARGTRERKLDIKRAPLAK